MTDTQNVISPEMIREIVRDLIADHDDCILPCACMEHEGPCSTLADKILAALHRLPTQSKHDPKISPCPTCGFSIRQVERKPFVFEDDCAEPAQSPLSQGGETLDTFLKRNIAGHDEPAPGAEAVALAALYEWYDRDGSVGGASQVFEQHRAVLRSPTIPAPAQGVTVTDEIAAERRRQIEQEGWSADHDDKHTDGSLPRAAACYAASASRFRLNREFLEKLWPWESKWWKPSTRRRDLVKAAALIVAEIERLDRAALEAALRSTPAKVTDEMVEKSLNVFWSHIHQREGMRAALEAALHPAEKL